MFIILLEFKNVADGSAPETVNTLVIIPHDTQVAMTCGKQIHQYILTVVGVLIFIDHDIAELFSVFFQRFGTLTEQGYRIENDIVKVHSIGGQQSFLIKGINLCNRGLSDVGSGLLTIGIRCEHTVLGTGKLCHDRLDGKDFFVNADTLHTVPKQTFLVIGIINGEMCCITECFAIAAQNSGTAGMEGRGPDILALFTNLSADTFF